MTTTLITGGVRSGKSRHAESLFDPEQRIVYLTPGYPADPEQDAEWAARVANHQAHRPAAWQTVETVELARALRTTELPVLIDCLGIWVTRVVDELNGWERPPEEWQSDFDLRLSDLAAAVAAHPADVVLVSNETGWGLVPPYPAGRIFADLLGHTNQVLAASVDQVILMVAGRPLHLPPVMDHAHDRVGDSGTVL
jgi:adenosylcobinamide kinase/adenosylcobinamide-phosphate guanylyltransferase